MGRVLRTAMMIAASVTLTGCLGAGPTPQQQELWSRTPGMGEIDWTKEQKAAKDDGICRGYGAQPGTPAYIQCRATQDQRRDAVLLSDSGAPAPVVNPAGAPQAASYPTLQPIQQPVRCQSMNVGLGQVQTVCR
jgi:hypothetical protein